MSIRIMLVDDHDVVRAGTRALLAERFDIVGEADNVESAIELIEERLPELVLLDVRLPGGGGESVIHAIRPKLPDIKFLAFTVSTSKPDVLRMMDAGVNGYMTKTTAGSDLADLIEQVREGLPYASPEVAGYLLDIAGEIKSDSALLKLTPREREVVGQIARGYTYKETARRLGISTKTLESHMANIFHKLSIASRHQLTEIAHREHFVRPEE